MSPSSEHRPDGSRAIPAAREMRLAVVVVVVSTIVCAAIAAALSRSSVATQRAATSVLVNGAPTASDPNLVALRTRRLASTISSPDNVAAAVAALAVPMSVSDARRNLTVRSDPETGRIEIATGARTTPDAMTLADQLAARAITTLGPTRVHGDDPRHPILSDFETDLDGWSAVLPNGARASLGRLGPARYNGFAARLRCAPVERCTASLALAQSFVHAHTVALSLWLRAVTSATVDLRFGHGRADAAIRDNVAVGPVWRRVVLTWSPRQDTDRVGIVLSARMPVESGLFIDGVTLNGPPRLGATPRPLSLAREARMFAAGPYAVSRPPEAIGRASSDTIAWTLIGAAIGFLVAVVGVLATVAARRRRALLATDVGGEERVAREPQLTERR